MKKILFFGDSITDCGRDKRSDDSMGYGYPLLVKAQLGYAYPGGYTFVNTGISGNRVVDLYARIKKDLINHTPDYVSILIGVNDVWHEIAEKNGVSAEKFELIYDMLVSEIKKELPQTKIMIMEPFVLEGYNTENTEENPERFKVFSKEVPVRAEISRKIADKYGLPFIELQERFTEAAKTAAPSYWLWDGVHPTPAGHEMIKREWLKAFEDIR